MGDLLLFDAIKHTSVKSDVHCTAMPQCHSVTVSQCHSVTVSQCHTQQGYKQLVVQRGRGTYAPKLLDGETSGVTASHFDFKPGLGEEIAAADLVTHALSVYPLFLAPSGIIFYCMAASAPVTLNGVIIRTP